MATKTKSVKNSDKKIKTTKKSVAAKKVANKTQIKPFTTPVSIDHRAVLNSFENIIPRPIIPTIAPNKMGNLIGFLKNIKPLKTVKSVKVEKIRQTIPETK